MIVTFVIDSDDKYINTMHWNPATEQNYCVIDVDVIPKVGDQIQIHRAVDGGYSICKTVECVRHIYRSIKDKSDIFPWSECHKNTYIFIR